MLRNCSRRQDAATDVASTDHAASSNFAAFAFSGADVRLPQFDVKIPDRRKLCREFEQPHRLDPVRQRHSLLTGIDDQPACWLEVIASTMESALDLGRQAALDFDGPKLGPGQFEQQVDLGTGRGAIVEG